VHVDDAHLAGELGKLLADACRVLEEAERKTCFHVMRVLLELVHLRVEPLELRQHVVLRRVQRPIVGGWAWDEGHVVVQDNTGDVGVGVGFSIGTCQEVLPLSVSASPAARCLEAREPQAQIVDDLAVIGPLLEQMPNDLEGASAVLVLYHDPTLACHLAAR